MIVYKLTSPENKSYIGSTQHSLDKRLREHKSLARTAKYPICKAIRKYGLNQFKIEILERCSTIKTMREKEGIWIKNLNTVINGYNLTYGHGTLGFKHNKKQKLANSKRMKAWASRNKDHYRKISNALWANDATRKRLVCAAKKRSLPHIMKERQRLATISRNNKREFLILSRDDNSIVLRTNSSLCGAKFIGVKHSSFFRYVRGERQHCKFIVQKRMLL